MQENMPDPRSADAQLPNQQAEGISQAASAIYGQILDAANADAQAPIAGMQPQSAFAPGFAPGAAGAPPQSAGAQPVPGEPAWAQPASNPAQPGEPAAQASIPTPNTADAPAPLPMQGDPSATPAAQTSPNAFAPPAAGEPAAATAAVTSAPAAAASVPAAAAAAGAMPKASAQAGPAASFGGPATQPVAGTPAVVESTPLADDASTISAYSAIKEHRQKKRRSRVIKSVAAAAVLAAIAAGAFIWSQNNNAATEEAPADTTLVTAGTYETKITASGATNPISSAVVTPEVDGIITDVLVSEGDYVQEGQKLFEIKNETLDKAVHDAERALHTAEQQAKTAQDAHNIALNHLNTVMVTEYDSMESAQAAVDEAQMSEEESQTALDTANDAVDAARETLQQAQDQAARRIITSPRAGTVVEVKAETGASVGGAAGGNGTQAGGGLATIGDLSQLRVNVQVNEVDINSIQTGQLAEVTFSALPDVMLNATVEHVSAVSSGASQSEAGAGGSGGSGLVTYDVSMVIAEPDPRVKSGMTARVNIVTERLEGQLMVPLDALVDNGDGTGMITVMNDNGTTIDRTVQIVAKNSTIAAITGNVAEGDEVVLSSTESEESADETNLEG